MEYSFQNQMGEPLCDLRARIKSKRIKLN
uniref:Uncharacterized protein n=1 Tax=Arundo donax TaxID=35708 RepID=A0A0A8Y2Y2_ARUDO